MKYLAEAQVAVLVTALLLGIGTVSTCAVVLGTTDDSERPYWINAALGMIPLAVALLAWSGALCVYTVAYLLSRYLQETTWLASVRADIFLLSAFLIWGFVANICMSVAVGLSIDAHNQSGLGSQAADGAGVATVVLTWICIVMLAAWLVLEITYVKLEYGHLPAVWSQSLRVLTPMRVRRGLGVNLHDPPSEKASRWSYSTRPTTHPIHRVLQTIPPLPRKARESMVMHAQGGGSAPRRERSRSGADPEREAARQRLDRAEQERLRHERRERRRRRRERRERRRAREAAAANRAAGDADTFGCNDHHDQRHEHCPTCGSHSRHWEPSRAAPTSPLRPEEANRRSTYYSFHEIAPPDLERPLPKLPSDQSRPASPAPSPKPSASPPLSKTPASPPMPTTPKTPKTPASPRSPKSAKDSKYPPTSPSVVAPTSPQLGEFEFSHEPGFSVALPFLTGSNDKLPSDRSRSPSPAAVPPKLPPQPYLSPHAEKPYYHDRLSRPTIKSVDLKSNED